MSKVSFALKLCMAINLWIFTMITGHALNRIEAPVAPKVVEPELPAVDLTPSAKSFIVDYIVLWSYCAVAIPKIVNSPEVSVSLTLIVVAIPFFFAMDILRRFFDANYHFCSRYVTARQGKLSFVLRQPRVEYCLIRGMRVVQGLTGRLFNFGDILLDTSASECSELKILGVNNPHQIKELIESRRESLCQIKYGNPEAWQYLEDTDEE